MATKSATKPAGSLKEYRAKRNFAQSPEPAGSEKLREVRKRRETKVKERFFCVQKHLASHLHYDFRLEHKGVLLSWAVPKGPSLNPADKRLAMHVEDHPLEYGRFEGVIPSGYGAGVVMLWDVGSWTPEPPEADVDEMMRKGQVKFTLNGFKLKGSWALVQTHGSRWGGRSEGKSWLLIKHRDEWAGDVDITTFAPLSVETKRDFEDILASGNPSIWESHRPVQGGETGALFEKIVRKAIAIKNANQAGKPPRRGAVSRSRTVSVKTPAGKSSASKRGPTRSGARRLGKMKS